MLQQLIEIDQSLFLRLNELHHPFFDPIMWWISDMLFWVPFYAFLMYLLIKKETAKWKNFDWKIIAFIVVSIALSITIADQVASGFCKPFFERLRPSHEPVLDGLVHLLKDPNGHIYKGGQFGFISSHAANSFALAIFLLQLFKPLKWRYWLVFWAIVVSYSRIYLGVHYPGDILGGALVGLFAGWTGSKVYFYLKMRFAK